MKHKKIHRDKERGGKRATFKSTFHKGPDEGVAGYTVVSYIFNSNLEGWKGENFRG